MSNLTNLYKERTYPASEVYIGMLLIIRDCDEEYIIDGTKAKVIEARNMCGQSVCSTEEKRKCCCREVRVQALDNENIQVTTCHCVLYTEDNRRLVPDYEHIQKVREKV